MAVSKSDVKLQKGPKKKSHCRNTWLDFLLKADSDVFPMSLKIAICTHCGEKTPPQ